MKMKYFLRGVGVGIIFGALIMLVAYLTSGASKLSDKEIIERAENLGMVMEDEMVITTNKEDSNNSTESSESNEPNEPNEDLVTTEMIISDDNNRTDAGIESEIIQGDDVSLEGVVDESIGTTTQEEATTEATTEKVDSVYTTAKITVTSGMTSYDVALMLQNAGIIDDCVDFDSYLNDNGYSTQIRINDYEFNSGMTYEEIAKALIKEDKQ